MIANIFASLPTAGSTIEAQAASFAPLPQMGIVLRVSQQTVLALILQVGQVSPAVEVNAEAVLLNSASAQLGQVVTNRYVTEVP